MSEVNLRVREGRTLWISLIYKEFKSIYTCDYILEPRLSIYHKIFLSSLYIIYVCLLFNFFITLEQLFKLEH